MNKLHIVLVAATTAALVLTACGRVGGDLLSDIKSRGYMVVATAQDYAPQSFLNTDAQRPAASKCPTDVLTTAEMQGFDVDVAAELGKRLGVDTCFATPDWDAITAGNWADKWDISVGSMTVTPERQKVLSFTTAYYYRVAALAVAKDSGITSMEQLSGRALCVAASSNYADWVNGTLSLPSEDIYVRAPAGATAVPLSTDQDCARALRTSSKDFVGYVTSGTVVDQNIANGLGVVKIGGAIFAENFAVALDKADAKDITSLAAALDGFVKAMHADGTLATLSNKWFQTDLTQPPTH